MVAIVDDVEKGSIFFVPVFGTEIMMRRNRDFVRKNSTNQGLTRSWRECGFGVAIFIYLVSGLYCTLD